MPSLRDAIDVRRLVAHQPVAVGADVGDADVVAPDDEDVRLGCGGLDGSWSRRSHLGFRRRWRGLRRRFAHGRYGEQRCAAQKNIPSIKIELWLRTRLGVFRFHPNFIA